MDQSQVLGKQMLKSNRYKYDYIGLNKYIDNDEALCSSNN